MTDDFRSQNPINGAIDLRALERILAEAGSTLRQSMSVEAAIQLLNMVVLETSSGATIPKISTARKDLERYAKTLADLKDITSKLRKLDFGAPLPDGEFLQSAKQWLDANLRTLEVDQSSQNREQLLTPFYPKALGLYAALIGETPTISVIEKSSGLECSKSVLFCAHLIQEARNAEPEHLLGREKPSEAEKAAIRGWGNVSMEALAKNLQKALKVQQEDNSGEGSRELKWKVYRDFYLQLASSGS